MVKRSGSIALAPVAYAMMRGTMARMRTMRILFKKKCTGGVKQKMTTKLRMSTKRETTLTMKRIGNLKMTGATMIQSKRRKRLKRRRKKRKTKTMSQTIRVTL
jgi:hypothetical protein